MVDDASGDDSLTVCRRYASQDSRVKVVAKPQNEGVESARFAGFAAAAGEYVMYVDSDDWLDHPQVLSRMHAAAVETGADYTEVRIQRVLDRRKLFVTRYDYPVTGLIEQPELFDRYFLSFFGINLLYVNIFGKLYRKEVLESACIKPSGLSMGEDLAYNMQLFPHLKRIYILDEAGYNYRVGGLTSHYNPHLLPDMKRLYAMRMQMIALHGYDKASEWLRIELKNVLRSEICQRITYGAGGGEQPVAEWLAQEIADPVYRDVLSIDGSSAFWNNAFVQAMASGDCAGMYELCRRRVRRERPRRMIRNLGFRLLNMF